MNYLYSIGWILFGIIILYITCKDEKKIKEGFFSITYSIHINGYIGSIGSIIWGMKMLSKELEKFFIVKEIFGLTIPLICIVVGLILKMSKKEKYKSVREYWLLFVIMGTLIFLFLYFLA
ncbi:hypothetical protein [Bacteroides sedimenti]|uniref:Uncharacterized protein n=1 Tax=Bacteroides sedimenti TaxID=2136147 RepID=A0ABM8IE61_9BACE